MALLRLRSVKLLPVNRMISWSLFGQRVVWFVAALMTGGIPVSVGDRAIAQLIQDETLGREESVIAPVSPAEIEIQGGARRGSNLFHSFRAFNVAERTAVYFANPAGVDTILTRITGQTRSQVQGTLGVRGRANLFLINPNGILFGPNAQLDMRGSFVATTANAVQFGDRGAFSTSRPNAPPLLSIDPSALLFTQLTNAAIINRSSRGLSVAPGQRLLFVGGDVQLNRGLIFARDSSVVLAGLAQRGRVELVETGDRLGLNFPGRVRRGHVSLRNQSRIVTVSNRSPGEITIIADQVELLSQSRLDAERITIEARSLALRESSVIDSGLNQAGGDIQIRASDSVSFTGGALLQNSSGPASASNLNLITSRLILREGSRISVSTTGTAPAGNVTILTDSLDLTGTSANGLYATAIESRSEDVGLTGNLGNAGTITIVTGTLKIQAGAQISTATSSRGQGGTIAVRAEAVELTGTSASGLFRSSLVSGPESLGDRVGRGGTIRISTGRLTIRDGALISASTANIAGAGGDIQITAASIELAGQSAAGQRSTIASQTQGNDRAGNAGTIAITTDRLSLRDGGTLSTSTLGVGQAGNIAVTADAVTIAGTTAEGAFPSFLGSVSGETATGNGGQVAISTRSLTVQDQAVLSTATLGEGAAGQLRVEAGESIAVRNGGQVSVGATAGGTAGNLQLTAPSLSVDNGEVTVSSPSGQAGNLILNVDEIRLNRGQLTAETGESPLDEAGAELQMQDVDVLLMDDRSQISARANARAAGGNIQIDAAEGLVIAVPDRDSNIVASASAGRGGNIQITTQGLFGLQEGIDRLFSNEIDASSQFGIAGTVTIDRLGVDPSQGLTELPQVPIDVAGLIDQSICRVTQGSEFVVTGRGGLPASPNETLTGEAVWEDWRLSEVQDSAQATDRPPETTASISTPAEIVEAQGWVVSANGKVMLTAAGTAVGGRSGLLPPDCQRQH